MLYGNGNGTWDHCLPLTMGGATCAFRSIVTGWQSYCANLPHWPLTKKSHTVRWCSVVLQFSSCSHGRWRNSYLLALIVRCVKIFVDLIFMVEYYAQKLNPTKIVSSVLSFTVYSYSDYHIYPFFVEGIFSGSTHLKICYSNIIPAWRISAGHFAAITPSLLKKMEPTLDICRGRWPVVIHPLITATAYLTVVLVASTELVISSPTASAHLFLYIS